MFLAIALQFPHPREWRKRRVYQIMTDRFASSKPQDQITPCTSDEELHSYCGGDFKGIVQKLDYIKQLGYDAIWISPTVDQAENSSKSYHGYSFADFYKTNLYFGSEQDFKNLISEAHKRNIWVMADVVYNHVGACNGGSLDYSCIPTFSKPEYFHPDPCIINNYDNETEVMD